MRPRRSTSWSASCRSRPGPGSLTSSHARACAPATSSRCWALDRRLSRTTCGCCGWLASWMRSQRGGSPTTSCARPRCRGAGRALHRPGRVRPGRRAPAVLTRPPLRRACSPRASAPACWSRWSSAPASPPAGSPRRRRPPAAGELLPTALGLAVLILLLGPGVRRPPQPRGHRRRLVTGRRAGTGLPGGESPPYLAAQIIGASRRGVARQPHVRRAEAARRTTERPGRACGSARSSPPPAWSLLVFTLVRTGRTALAGPRGRRLHRRGVLVHLQHLVRQPRGHRRPGVHRHLRRDRPRVRARLRRSPSSSARAVGLGLASLLHPVYHRPGEDSLTQPPQVVFACRKNGGRSVISRVLTEHYAGDRVVALSAGTEPGEQIHPEVARVLEASASTPRASRPRP